MNKKTRELKTRERKKRGRKTRERKTRELKTRERKTDGVIQTGGVISISDARTAFVKFFTPSATSSIEYLAEGADGVTFICTNDESDYYAFRPHLIAQLVTRVIIKISVLDSSRPSTSKIGFDNEISLQQEVVNSTISYFEPVSPTILYHSNDQTMANLLRLNPYFNDFFNRRKSVKPNDMLGVIVMECAGDVENFSRLDALTQSRLPAEKTRELYAVSIFELFRLALAGINQGDYHRNNILTSTSYPDYFLSDDETLKWYSGKRSMIIDYGRANRFTDEQTIEFNRCYNLFTESDNFDAYQRCIMIIRENGQYIDKRPVTNVHFKWFLTSSYGDKGIMDLIIELDQARNRSIAKTVENMQKRVTDTIGSFDELPLNEDYDRFNWVNKELIKFVIQHIIEVEGQMKGDRPSASFSRQNQFQDVDLNGKGFELSKTKEEFEYLKNMFPGNYSSSAESSSHRKTEGNAKGYLPSTSFSRQDQFHDVVLNEKGFEYLKGHNLSSSDESYDPYALIKKDDKQYNYSGGVVSPRDDFNALIALIGNIDLNKLIEVSCFAIAFILYSYGKSNGLEQAFETLCFGLQNSSTYNIPKFVNQNEFPLTQGIKTGGVTKKHKKERGHKKTQKGKR